MKFTFFSLPHAGFCRLASSDITNHNSFICTSSPQSSVFARGNIFLVPMPTLSAVSQIFHSVFFWGGGVRKEKNRHLYSHKKMVATAATRFLTFLSIVNKSGDENSRRQWLIRFNLQLTLCICFDSVANDTGDELCHEIQPECEWVYVVEAKLTMPHDKRIHLRACFDTESTPHDKVFTIRKRETVARLAQLQAKNRESDCSAQTRCTRLTEAQVNRCLDDSCSIYRYPIERW